MAEPGSDASSSWAYSERQGELRGTLTRLAKLESENKLNLCFPYGESSGYIVLRRAGGELAVMLAMDDGRFVCNSIGGNVSVKFDDGGIQRFECAETTDGTANVIFLRSASRFVRELKDSKRVQIEAEFFRAGLQQLAFSTAGLSW
jgi:hypothetical protein